MSSSEPSFMDHFADASTNESSDDHNIGRLLRMVPSGNEEDSDNGASQRSKVSLDAFITTAAADIGDNHISATLEHEKVQMKKHASNLQTNVLGSSERHALERKLVQKQAFGDIRKWESLIDEQMKENVQLNFVQTPAKHSISARSKAKFLSKASLDTEIDGILADAGLAAAELSDSLSADNAMPHEGANNDESKDTAQDPLASASLLNKKASNMQAAEIAKLRAIIYYNEQKLKRWAQIKSKRFRKIHNRERRQLRLTATDQKMLRLAQASSALDENSTYANVASQMLSRQYDAHISSYDALAARMRGEGDAGLQERQNDVDSPLPSTDDDNADGKHAHGVTGLAFMKRAMKAQKEMIDQLTADDDADSGSSSYEGPLDGTDNENETMFTKRRGRPVTGDVLLTPTPASGTQQSAAEIKAMLFPRGAADTKHRDAPAKVEEHRKSRGASAKVSVTDLDHAASENPFLANITSDTNHDPTNHGADNRVISTASLASLSRNNVPDKRGKTHIMASIQKMLQSRQKQNTDAVAEAFGIDNGADEFQEAKERTQASELVAPTTPQDTPDGWGAWLGDGVSDRQKQRMSFKDQARREAVRLELQQQLQKRRDAKFKNVIISEAASSDAVQKFAARGLFNVSDDAYKAYLETGLSPEWQSVSAYRSSIASARVVQKGRIIKPASMPQTYVDQMSENVASVSGLKKHIDTQNATIKRGKTSGQKRKLKF